MKWAVSLLSFFFVVGCAPSSATKEDPPPNPTEKKAFPQPEEPAYQPIGFDLSTKPWKGNYDGFHFKAVACSYHHFYSEGFYVEQVYCKAFFDVRTELIYCPILMVQINGEDPILGLVPEESAHDYCDGILPVFGMEPEPKPQKEEAPTGTTFTLSHPLKSNVQDTDMVSVAQ